MNILEINFCLPDFVFSVIVGWDHVSICSLQNGGVFKALEGVHLGLESNWPWFKNRLVSIREVLKFCLATWILFFCKDQFWTIITTGMRVVIWRGNYGVLMKKRLSIRLDQTWKSVFSRTYSFSHLIKICPDVNETESPWGHSSLWKGAAACTGLWFSGGSSARLHNEVGSWFGSRFNYFDFDLELVDFISMLT